MAEVRLAPALGAMFTIPTLVYRVQEHYPRARSRSRTCSLVSDHPSLLTPCTDGLRLPSDRANTPSVWTFLKAGSGVHL